MEPGGSCTPIWVDWAMRESLVTAISDVPPAGWAWKRIGEIVQPISRPIRMRDGERYRLVSLRRRFGGMFERERLYGRQILTKGLEAVVPGVFILARMQIVHGACALVPDEFAGSVVSKSYVQLASQESNNIRWFYWLARTPQMRKLFFDASHGVVIEKMTFSLAHWMNFRTLAPPAAEQLRIADILDAVEDEIRKTEQVIAKLGEMRRGVLHNLLTRGIDENGELRDPERHPEQFKDSSLGRIPRRWDVVSLGSVVPKSEYGISASLSERGEIPVLRMMNFVGGEAQLSDLKYCDSPKARSLLLEPGDVLFNRTNSIDHVGRTGIWRGQLAKASFASYLVRLVPATGRLTSEFLNRWLNWELTQIRIRRWATPGVHQVNINPTNLRKTLIALPNSVAEQERVAEVLLRHDDYTAAISVELDKLSSLRNGLMDALLTGRVRVQASDEAA
jgi:type I restriction enzyme S subunit